MTISDDDPMVLTLDEETDSEDERLLASYHLNKFRTAARATNPGSTSLPSGLVSSPLPSLPPSRKRPRSQSTADDTTQGLKLTPAQARKAAQAVVRERKKALAEANAQERERARAEKFEAERAKELARIRRAFSDAASRGTFRREEVNILVSTDLFVDRRLDVLNHARALFPTQIIAMDMGIQNLVTWRRKPGFAASSVKDGSEEKESLLIFSGSHFWELLSLETLEEYAEYVTSKRRGEKITFVIYGIESECKKRTRLAVKPGSRETIISMQAIQDCYTLLFMQYGIRTHACSSVMDVSKYILELTHAFTEKPYHEQDDFLDATLRYRDSRKKISNRSTVISTGEFSGVQINQDGFDFHGDEGELGIDERYNVFGEDGSVVGPFVRAEGREDLGLMYLSFLVLIPRVSIEKAMAIRRRYPLFLCLFQAYKSCSSLDEQYGLLADLRYGPSGRRIGPALSKLIATVLTSRDHNGAFEM